MVKKNSKVTKLVLYNSKGCMKGLGVRWIHETFGSRN